MRCGATQPLSVVLESDLTVFSLFHASQIIPLLLRSTLGDRNPGSDKGHGPGRSRRVRKGVWVVMAQGARERRQLLFHVDFIQHFQQELYCA